MTNLDSVFKSWDITLLTKAHIAKVIVFPVIVYGYESWTIKKVESQRTDGFELWCWRRLLNSKEIKPVNPKGNQPWIFTGGTDAEAETPILWPHDAKSQLFGKDPDAGKDWGQEEKGATEDEMVGDDILDSMDMSLSKLQEIVKDRKPGGLWSMGLHRVGHVWVNEQQIPCAWCPYEKKKIGHRDREQQEEGHVMMEAKIGVK